MMAPDFDVSTHAVDDLGHELPAGYDEWPIGDGSGAFNRRHDGPDGRVVMDVRVRYGRVIIETMPIQHEDTGGLEGRFGTWTPDDVNTGPMADYQPDTRDQLATRPLGANGPYDVYGRTVESSDMAGGVWPGDADLSATQAAEWTRARGDDHAAAIFEQLASEGL